jgi:hypothetical protein
MLRSAASAEAQMSNAIKEAIIPLLGTLAELVRARLPALYPLPVHLLRSVSVVAVEPCQRGQRR